VQGFELFFVCAFEEWLFTTQKISGIAHTPPRAVDLRISLDLNDGDIEVLSPAESA
jgi:hypothetical protein